MSVNDPEKLAARLSKIKHIVLVLSGKGGVGKSSVAVQLALSLLTSNHDASSSSNNKIGLLDVDLTGPSIPRMLGLDGAAVHQSNDGWVPVYFPVNQQPAKEGDTVIANGINGRSSGHAEPDSSTEAGKRELKVMSIGFLLRDSRQAVVWRGPKKSAMIRQFLADVRWGELDWLVVDTPPGKPSPLLTVVVRKLIAEIHLDHAYAQAHPTSIFRYSRTSSLRFRAHLRPLYTPSS